MSTVPSRFIWWGGALLAASLSCCALAQSASVPAQSSAASATAPDPATTIKSLRHSIDTGHAADALKAIVELRAQNGAMPDLSRIEGLARYSQSELTLADAAFAAALKEDPNDIESAQMRGLTLFRLGRPADAIPLLEFASAKGGPGQGRPQLYPCALLYGYAPLRRCAPRVCCAVRLCAR